MHVCLFEIQGPDIEPIEGSDVADAATSAAIVPPDTGGGDGNQASTSMISEKISVVPSAFELAWNNFEVHFSCMQVRSQFVPLASRCDMSYSLLMLMLMLPVLACVGLLPYRARNGDGLEGNGPARVYCSSVSPSRD